MNTSWKTKVNVINWDSRICMFLRIITVYIFTKQLTDKTYLTFLI